MTDGTLIERVNALRLSGLSLERISEGLGISRWSIAELRKLDLARREAVDGIASERRAAGPAPLAVGHALAAVGERRL
nr:hypothetical protein [uncultured Lichenicoccus sp.]